MKELKTIEFIANKYYSGHYTILKFTNGFKFSFGTITKREEIYDLNLYDNLRDALINGIQFHICKDL